MPKKTPSTKRLTRIWSRAFQSPEAPDVSVPEPQPQKRRRGRPSYSDNGLEYPFVRTSLMIDKDLYGKIRFIANVNSLNISDICNSAISRYVRAYERKNGTISSPQKKIVSADDLV